MVLPPYRRLIGISALALWCASLALPVETDCDGFHAARGYDILALGWFGPIAVLISPLAVLSSVGWYANPFMLWQSGRLLLNRRPGVVGSGISVILAWSSLFWTVSPTGGTVCQRHLGFYLWMACAVLLVTTALGEWPAYVDHKLKSRREAS